MTGVNYPWRSYGGDFGPTVWGTHTGVAASPAEIADDFAAMAAHGVEVARWFVFTDARGGIEVDRAGWPDGLRPGTLDDLDAALAIAAGAGVQLVPVLFDHTLAFRGHRRPAAPGSAATARGSAIRTGRRDCSSAWSGPVVARYGPRGPRADLAGAIHAWDLLNEPDWIVAELAPSRKWSSRCPSTSWRRGSARRPAWFTGTAPGSPSAAPGCASPRGGTTRGSISTSSRRTPTTIPAHDFDVLATSAGALGLDASTGAG